MMQENQYPEYSEPAHPKTLLFCQSLFHGVKDSCVQAIIPCRETRTITPINSERIGFPVWIADEVDPKGEARNRITATVVGEKGLKCRRTQALVERAKLVRSKPIRYIPVREWYQNGLRM